MCIADLQFNYGLSGDQPIAGDWNNDGIATIGVFRSGMFYLRNANSTGNADLAFAFGTSGDLPIAGNWDALPPPPPPPTATPTSTPPSPSAASASFTYDGDGKRVKSVINATTTTYFVGAYYEVANGVVTKYYYAGTQRIATLAPHASAGVRTNGTLNYLLGDHLGSTSLTTDGTGTVISELRYKAWGEVRYAWQNTPTKYQFTGQFSYESDFGLYFYNARWYDPYLNHFTQPDTIVPDPYNPQDWNRYSYARNNPVRYNDPSGHRPCEDDDCEINPLAYKITYDFGWILKGDDWTGKELQTIFSTGNKIKNYVDDLTNGMGQQWMDAYLSGTNIVHSPWNLPQNQNLTLPGWFPGSGGTNTVNLFPGWLNQDGGGRWLVHEMGHIWDMNTAWGVGVTGAHGGVGDDLNTGVGGNIVNSIFRSRFWNDSGKKSIPSDAQYAKGYANNSTADYLAETFTFQIYPALNPGRGGSASSWVQAFIILQADELR